MASAAYTDVTRRHDFMLLIDVLDGNPNGDPDAGNLPRVDPETMQGLITDVCLKRKIRNFVDAVRGREERYKIYIQDTSCTLNELHERAYSSVGIKPVGSGQPRDQISRVRAWMCENFYDIRTFGAVMSTRVNCGQVRGPVQLTFARSIDPVLPLDMAITRVAVTTRKHPSQHGETEETSLPIYGEMGRKAILPYGLYRCFGFINPLLAADTGFCDEDLMLLWRSILEMWDLDRCAARGLMACQGLYVFTHRNAVGNAPADRLFSLIEISRKPGVLAARSFADYAVHLRKENLPQQVELNTLKASELLT